MAARSAQNPITATLAVVGIGAVLSFTVGVVVGLVTGDMAKSIGSVVTWGMVLTAVAAAGAAALASRQAESTADETG